MPEQLKVNNSVIRLVTGDITAMEIEAFVFYARPDLALGSGFGGAIAVRGGPSIQEELKALGTRDIGDVVITKAGNMKAEHIVHAVGPRFQEPDLESKLQATITNALKEADAKGIRKIAMPPMGAGFYGVPLPDSVRMTVQCTVDYLQGKTGIEEVVLCANDNREFKAFDGQLAAGEVAG